MQTETVRRINELLNSMEKHIERIKGESIKDLVLILRPKLQLKVLDMLIELHDGPYMELHRIWTLPGANDDMWDNYDVLFRVPQHNEHIMMSNARRVFKIGYNKIALRVQRGAKKVTDKAKAGGSPEAAMDTVSGGEGMGVQGDAREHVSERLS
jgi:hypothetical protein